MVEGRAPDGRLEKEGETQTIVELYARAEQATGRPQRAIERFTRTVGRPLTLFAVLAFVASWIGFHSLRRSFDPPPFFWLQGIVGLFALLVATMVLIAQNRQGKHAQQRDLLDLHVNLLVEQKVAKLIALIEELRRDLPSVTDRPDPEAQAMAQSVDPHAVTETLERGLEALKKDPEGPADA
jgi:uncharacterized membrane protein